MDLGQALQTDQPCATYVEHIALEQHQALADHLLHANCIAYKQMEALILPILKMSSV